jgi:hypothetical protein
MHWFPKFIFFVKKLYMFRAVPLHIIRSFPLYIRHWYMSCRFDDSFRAGPGWNCVPSWSCSKAVWHKPLLSVQWINSWWWTEELPETCRFSWQNKFGKLVHLLVLLKMYLNFSVFASSVAKTWYGFRSILNSVWVWDKCICTYQYWIFLFGLGFLGIIYIWSK